MNVELSFLAFGAIIFFLGVILANIAVVQMSKRLNSEYAGREFFHWWNSIGHGASLVVDIYRQRFPGKKDELEKRLRTGYWITGLGLAIMFGITLLHSANRGSF